MLPDPAADIRLTRKEAQLLALLQQNPGTCFSRDYLLQAIWGYKPGVKSRTVDVHVWKLRAKLDAGRRNCLRTVLGRGYCWQPEPNSPPELAEVKRLPADCGFCRTSYRMGA